MTISDPKVSIPTASPRVFIQFSETFSETVFLFLFFGTVREVDPSSALGLLTAEEVEINHALLGQLSYRPMGCYTPALLRNSSWLMQHSRWMKFKSS